MKVVPLLLYQHNKVRKIMVDGLSSIVHKTIDTIDTETDHYVASHVISIVLKGKLKIQTYYEAEQFLASQNQVVFIPKGRYMISDIIPENDEFEALFFFIEDSVINDFLKNKKDLISNKALNYVMEYSSELKVFTETILVLYQNNSNSYKDITKLKLMELLYLFYNSNQKNNFIGILKSLQKTTKRNIKEIMELNFDKPLLVEDYAFLTGRSLSTFRRDFKRNFGTTPKKWLISKRLEKAEKLLSTSELTINEVSLEIGFENVSHFISLFGKTYKETPKQYLIRERMTKIV
ncbi:hypothetical protein SY27_16395 [Flavobacterium sp. 316]|uniref:helix-turn-helix domain-containing protein n=1 Tax=Flavobacterium sp. 316 TaxID=1603293 RepID=UPI0005DE49AC|nr:AraC family transcriptional regulator [Flavobacterium sp. 316]KIX20090.1 hypothetical protein SY27_16395 [Flavobacterium sp. 316]